MNDQPTVDQITARLDELEARGRSGAWLDTAAKVGGILSPVVLLFLGFYLQQPLRELERATEDRRLELAQTSSKIEQVKIIASFLDALAGTDERKKVIAIQALLIALPEEGPQLVRQISGEGESVQSGGGGGSVGPLQNGGAVAAAATDALTTRRQALINGLYSSDKATRLASFSDLQKGFGSDTAALTTLLEVAPRRLEQADGTINALVFMKVYSGDRPSEQIVEQIKAFANSARANGRQTAGHAQEVLKRWS